MKRETIYVHSLVYGYGFSNLFNCMSFCVIINLHGEGIDLTFCQDRWHILYILYTLFSSVASASGLKLRAGTAALVQSVSAISSSLRTSANVKH